MQEGKFVTFEGIEGVGKSTNIDYLVGLIEAHGHKVLKTREPGGTPIAEDIRKILKEHGDEPMSDVAELLLLFAARFTDSTRAYQGGARGFPRDSIEWLANFVHGDLQPDLTILLDTPVETAMARAGRRGEPDRFEVEKADFFQQARATYLQLAAEEPERFVVVDVSSDIDSVRAVIGDIAKGLLSN
jgi:dTMP kinase